MVSLLRITPSKLLLSILVLSCLILSPQASLGGDKPSDVTNVRTLTTCEGHYAEPLLGRALPSRSCGPPEERKYTPRHHGIGFEILDSESKACFVPDQEYELLDELIDAVTERVTYSENVSGTAARTDQALKISKTVSDTLEQQGFALAIDTVTLSDTLIQRDVAVDHAKHVFDCDTGSFIFLTIAENLKAPVAMVRMELPSENYHYWVRWLDGAKTLLEWDMNGRLQCRTPSNLPDWQGRSMNRKETLGYALSLRATLWERNKQYDMALSDYQSAMTLEPNSPIGYNDFAWLVATKEVPQRTQLKAEALKAAQRAVSIAPNPNHWDTLACAYALVGDYSTAIRLETNAVNEYRKASFQTRLAQFKAEHPKDCTGADDSDEQ
jgi:tetratricopeptide (TPR) repeat protein